MSLYDGVPKIAMGRATKPAYVYVCQSAFGGVKEHTAQGWRQRNVGQLALGCVQESISVVDEDQVWVGGTVESGCGYVDKLGDVAISSKGRCW